MESTDYVTYGYTGLITAIICGKWAMEFSFRQSRQLLWMVAGLLVPPVALLALYVRHIRQLHKQGEAGGRL
jgi:hypothetical protein